MSTVQLDKPVLDKGYVQLLAHMTDETDAVDVARVSHLKEAGDELTDGDRRLMRFLAAKEHTSPFRHSTIRLRFKAPVFVARQLWKHVIGIDVIQDVDDNLHLSGGYKDTGWNEASQRYVALPEEFYVPSTWRAQDNQNRQGSAGVVSDQLEAHDIYQLNLEASYQDFQELLQLGVAKEQARMVLGSSLYTVWIWTLSLQAYFHVLHLRDKPEAQWETRQYAIAMREILDQLLPETTRLWFDTDGQT